MKNLTESEVLHRMASYCSMKEYCTQDIRKKIDATGLSPEECDRIINRLCSEKFLNEERFTRAYIKDKLRFSKWGRIKIKYELRKKDIPSSLIEALLDETEESAYQTLLKDILIQKKKSTKGKSPQDIYSKLFRFAAGRGFESHLISSCLKTILNTDPDEADFD